MRKIRKTLNLSFLIIFIFVSLGCHIKPYRKVCANNFCVHAEVVTIPLEREIGLMYRTALAPDEGMLFVFEKEEEHLFWMKNMAISLDIIWLGADRKIVGILPDARPCAETCPDLTVGKASKYVLEVNSGFADKHQLKTGDMLCF